MSSHAKHNPTDYIRIILFCLLPASFFFSYYPFFFLGSNDTMNFELSIPLVLLFLFALFSVPEICRLIQKLPWKKSLIIFSLPLYATISLCWTENLVRGVLTAGILWCIVIATLSIYELYSSRKCCKKYNNLMLIIYSITTLVVCLFCILQCILDVAGIGRETTLLCLGCTSASFGFPHPSGFAIEPQFMGNLLLFPALLSIYGLLYFDQYFTKKKTCILAVSFSSIAIFTLFLTFSRGAIYSFVIATAALLIFEKVKNKKKILRPIIISLACIVLSIISQGIMSAVSYTDSTFLSGISSSLSQLSLGTINIKAQAHDAPAQTEQVGNSSAEEKPIFDGYVENSTNERLLLLELAFNAWNENYKSFAFGHGIGSSGVVIHRLFPNHTDEKEIIQNEPLAVLLELGITGLMIVVILLVMICNKIRKEPTSLLFYSIILAFALSLMFFSGLTNALHIYILPAILFLLIENKLVINKISNKHC